jgi:TetR/AcrR family transcriptional regulator, cholesterol catabolism regulator
MTADRIDTTEARIRREATELFYERGYHATSMRDIAARVGIKAGSLYNHFPGKQDLLLRISLEATRELYGGAIARLDGIDDAEEALRTYVRWHVEFHATHRLDCRVADTELRALTTDARRAVVEVRDAHEELCAELLRRGVRERGWHVENERVVSIAILTLCTEVDAWFRDDGPLTATQVADIYADLIVHGLEGARA